VLANLVSNAIDAAPVGGMLCLHIEEREEETGLAVHDNGCGMSEAVQARIFEPFFSTKGDLGNGLGLYISHEVMERHRGRLEVESDDVHGTTMTIWLPRGRRAERLLIE
jgi:signal transduction histidine kinase